MQRTLSTAPLSALAALSFLSACSPNPQAPSPAFDEKEFSEEDKRAARALSISNNQAVMEATNPYARALLCRNGIDGLAERFQQARGPMMEEQQQAMEQARAYFDEQLRLLAEREGKSEAELNDDLEETGQQHADPGENAQIAVACLRRLQQTI